MCCKNSGIYFLEEFNAWFFLLAPTVLETRPKNKCKCNVSIINCKIYYKVIITSILVRLLCDEEYVACM
jgi:hypothetical protein